MIAWVAGYKYNTAATAAILNQTATIFTVILAVLFLREKLNLRKTLGAIVATAGVLMVSLL